MKVKYNRYKDTIYEYLNILEIKDYPDLNFFILKSATNEYCIPKYDGIDLIIDMD